jgi:hypothetical protein
MFSSFFVFKWGAKKPKILAQNFQKGINKAKNNILWPFRRNPKSSGETAPPLPSPRYATGFRLSVKHLLYGSFKLFQAGRIAKIRRLCNFFWVSQ